jgi:hypothetical protein
MNITLSCGECGKAMTLDREEQGKILATLTQPASTAIVECRCQKFQFVLAARRKTAR